MKASLTKEDEAAFYKYVNTHPNTTRQLPK
jgi:hypothetical protein